MQNMFANERKVVQSCIYQCDRPTSCRSLTSTNVRVFAGTANSVVIPGMRDGPAGGKNRQRKTIWQRPPS